MKLFKKSLAIMLVAIMVCASFSFTVEAKSKLKPLTTKYVKSFSVSKSSLKFSQPGKQTVNARVVVKGKASKGLSVTSTDKSVATASVKTKSNGKSTITITTKKKGEAVIKVTTKAPNKNRKKVVKKIKVVVEQNAPVPATNVIITQKSVKIKINATTQLTATAYPAGTTDKITWSSSNTSVATVSPTGLVKATAKEGTAVITATAGKYKSTCNIIVYRPFSAADYKVDQLTDKTVHIEFTAKDEETANLYKGKTGYTVDGKKVSGDVPCESYKYTFYRLPSTLEDIKQIKLDNKCAPMAAMVCALNTVDTNMPSSTFASVNGNTLLPMFNYLGGPACNLLDSSKTSPLLHAQFLADRMFTGRGGCPYLKTCYFDGATPENKYTPTKPYTITMYVGPYYISEHTMLDGSTRPMTYMVLTEFAGDDSARYIDVYQSKNGNWYALNSAPYETFKQLMAKPKDVKDSVDW